MGAPAGNQNARKRHWANAIEAAVLVEDPRTRRHRLYAIAEKLTTMAEEGDIQAMKEIGDRLDGRAAQSIDVTGDMTFRGKNAPDDVLEDIALGREIGT